MREALLLVVACTVAWLALLVWVDRLVGGDWLPGPQGRGPAFGESAMDRAATAPTADPGWPRTSRLAAAVPSGSPLLVPVIGVSPRQIEDTYGDARGRGRQHEGIDILAPRHTPVVAADHGQVERLFDNRRGGISIYQVDATGTLCYYYAHLEGYAPGIEEGLVVRRGDLLGYVGTSGNAPETVPHLHFGVYRLARGSRCVAGLDGEPVDPLPLLGRR